MSYTFDFKVFRVIFKANIKNCRVFNKIHAKLFIGLYLFRFIFRNSQEQILYKLRDKIGKECIEKKYQGSVQELREISELTEKRDRDIIRLPQKHQVAAEYGIQQHCRRCKRDKERHVVFIIFHGQTEISVYQVEHAEIYHQ